MINFRKIMLGTGAMTAVVAPVVGVVSCGDEGYHWDGNFKSGILDYWQNEQPEIYNEFNENFAYEDNHGNWWLDWSVFPGSIKGIDRALKFNNMDKIRYITNLPDSVTWLDGHAFLNLYNLTTVTIVSENIKHIGNLFNFRSEGIDENIGSPYQGMLENIYLDCPNAEIVDGAFSKLKEPEARALTIRLPKKFDSDSERGRLFGGIYDEALGRQRYEVTQDELWEYGHIICVYQDR